MVQMRELLTGTKWNKFNVRWRYNRYDVTDSIIGYPFLFSAETRQSKSYSNGTYNLFLSYVVFFYAFA